MICAALVTVVRSNGYGIEDLRRSGMILACGAHCGVDERSGVGGCCCDSAW